MTKISKSVFQLKISKYRLYRRRFLRGFRHFSAFFAIYPNILEKMRQNVKKCKNPSHKISEIFRKSAKNGHILILWLYSILWYFAGFLHFHFEICENLQRGKEVEVQAAPGYDPLPLSPSISPSVESSAAPALLGMPSPLHRQPESP